MHSRRGAASWARRNRRGRSSRPLDYDGAMSLSATQTVPFLDLTLQHAGLRADILADVAAIVDSSAFVNGPQVADFEQAYAAYCGADHCVGVASGLDALRLILLGLGI